MFVLILDVPFEDGEVAYASEQPSIFLHERQREHEELRIFDIHIQLPNFSNLPTSFNLSLAQLRNYPSLRIILLQKPQQRLHLLIPPLVDRSQEVLQLLPPYFKLLL